MVVMVGGVRRKPSADGGTSAELDAATRKLPHLWDASTWAVSKALVQKILTITKSPFVATALYNQT